MSQQGYQDGNDSTWWWKVALHLDEAQSALANAMAHNVDDPRSAYALYDRLREGQAILLDIFRMKGLIPASSTPGPQMAPVPPSLPMQMPLQTPTPEPQPSVPMVPIAVVLPFPAQTADDVDDRDANGVDPSQALAAEEPSVKADPPDTEFAVPNDGQPTVETSSEPVQQTEPETPPTAPSSEGAAG